MSTHIVTENAAKKPHDIGEMLTRIENAISPFPKAAMFELRERGYGTLWQQLAACILSIRTYDETSLPAALRLFERASSPSQLLQLSVDEIDELIRDCTFHEAKAHQLLEIAERVAREWNDELPPNRETLLSLRGVGPKCANLALGVAHDIPVISVDIHVHRVTNRWGYVGTKTPEKTMLALEQKLPREHWIDINRLLVPFGKHICTGTLPKCSTCPVLEMCQQVGVTKHR
jgi:endonuclease III